MANLAIYKDNYIESTAISNYFIDNYMKDANDAQLKVYLYLVRMVHSNMAFGVRKRTYCAPCAIGKSRICYPWSLTRART